jgi:hypothetical protein
MINNTLHKENFSTKALKENSNESIIYFNTFVYFNLDDIIT